MGAPRQKQRKIDPKDGDPANKGPFLQVSRMAIRWSTMLIINTDAKDQQCLIRNRKRISSTTRTRARACVLARLQAAHRPPDPAARRLTRVEPDRPDEDPAQVSGPGIERLELRQSVLELLRLDLRSAPARPRARGPAPRWAPTPAAG
jgi:hypothetical protein